MKFDKDVRLVINYFSLLTEEYVADYFDNIHNIISILNVENVTNLA